VIRGNTKKYILLHAGASFMEEFESNSTFELTLVNPALNSLFVRVLRRLHLKFFPKSIHIWIYRLLLQSHIKNDGTEVIVVFDTDIWLQSIEYLVNKYDKTKVVVWYWNIVKNETLLNLCKRHAHKVCTFDMGESEKYNIGLHNQFYWINPDGESENLDAIYDVVFVGRLKGRLSKLEEIYTALLSQGIGVYFYVVKDSRADKSTVFDLKDTFLSYNDVCNLISNSRAILDVVQPGQEGMTLRALESVFWQKKLITDNINVRKEGFYNDGNVIFIQDLLIDNILIHDFLSRDGVRNEREILQKYGLDQWLREIDNDME